MNQQNIVYFYKCGLCDVDYGGFMSPHLHQIVKEHKWSTVGKGSAWKGSGDHWKQFQDFEKNVRVNLTDSDFWNSFYS